MSEFSLVYHFIPACHALEDLKKRRLKLSEFGRVNDYSELTAYSLEEVDKEAKECVKKFTLFLCLGHKSDSRILWERYGDQNKGICLGLEIAASDLRRITYRKKLLRKALPADLRSIPDEGSLEWSEFIERMYPFFEPYITTKFKTFTNKKTGVVQNSGCEKEWRAVSLVPIYISATRKREGCL